jgi:hypothetical protein
LPLNIGSLDEISDHFVDKVIITNAILICFTSPYTSLSHRGSRLPGSEQAKAPFLELEMHLLPSKHQKTARTIEAKHYFHIQAHLAFIVCFAQNYPANILAFKQNSSQPP